MHRRGFISSLVAGTIGLFASRASAQPGREVCVVIHHNYAHLYLAISSVVYRHKFVGVGTEAQCREIVTRYAAERRNAFVPRPIYEVPFLEIQRWAFGAMKHLPMGETPCYDSVAIFDTSGREITEANLDAAHRLIRV